MKQYSIQILVYIVFIGVLSVCLFLLIQKQLWFSAFVILLFLIATGFSLYKLQMKYLGIMQRLADSIRFNDFTQTFPVHVKNKMMQEMSNNLTDALQQLKSKQLEEEIRHQYYENLLDKVDTAVLVTVSDGQVEWMNRTARLLFKDQSKIPGLLKKISSSENGIVRTGTGSHIQEMAVSYTTFNAQGKERLLISLKDIHSVLEKNEMEAWQKLIRVLTHEIMNSITPIISLSETISDRAIPKEPTERDYKVMHQAMQTIHRRSRGLLDFVENYRRLTRLPAPILSDVSIKDLFADLQKLFPGENIVFENNISDTTINADRSQIEQVLINLLKNALESTIDNIKPEITIRSARNNLNQQIQISVCDNGTGILPDVMDKIFVPFFTTKQTGSGIGLNLCKQIINQHKGSIRVESEPGKGSCFTLSFPV